MAEVNAKDLTTKTAPASTDSMLLFGTTTNEGAKITVDNLANNILERLATKTFPNQVGGSSAATILAQLATLNSNLPSLKTLYSQREVSMKTSYSKVATVNIEKQGLLIFEVQWGTGYPTGIAIAGENAESTNYAYAKCESTDASGKKLLFFHTNTNSQTLSFWARLSQAGVANVIVYQYA